MSTKHGRCGLVLDIQYLKNLLCQSIEKRKETAELHYTYLNSYNTGWYDAEIALYNNLIHLMEGIKEKIDNPGESIRCGETPVIFPLCENEGWCEKHEKYGLV